jgi:nitrogenase molybdenum-iron protein beta chain
MLEREVVFGGEQKLRDEIDGTLEIIDGDAFFILTGCTAGIIGDDIEQTAADYQERGYPVYAVTLPGFAGDSLLGYEAAFDVLLTYVAEKNPVKKPTLVNLVGIVPHHDPYWEGTFEELSRILRRLGLEVNTFFTEEQGLENVKSMTSAALNIIVNPWLLERFAKKALEEYAIPSIRIPGVPIGATQATEFVKAVAATLKIDGKLVESVIDCEERYVYHYLETVIGGLSWKRFVVAADAGTAVSVTRFLTDDMSFTPVAVIVTENVWSDRTKRYIIEHIQNLEYARPPEVSFLSDNYDIREKIHSYPDVTLLVASSLEEEVAIATDVQLHVMSFPMTDKLVINRTYGGYRGCLTLIEDLFNNL